MFIRWKGKYAYLERRYFDDGKVRSESSYLGSNPLRSLETMLSKGQIDKYDYDRIVKWEPEGTLQPTDDGGFHINGGRFGYPKGTQIGVFFANRWLIGKVFNDEHGWYLTDNDGHILCLRTGMRARRFWEKSL